MGNQAKHRATSGPAQLGLKRQASNGLNADQTTLKLVTENFSLVAIAGEVPLRCRPIGNCFIDSDCSSRPKLARIYPDWVPLAVAAAFRGFHVKRRLHFHALTPVVPSKR